MSRLLSKRRRRRANPPGRLGLGGPGELEKGLRAPRAVIGRLELVRAGGAAGGTALDAAELIEREPELTSAAALRAHQAPPWSRVDWGPRQEANQEYNLLI